MFNLKITALAVVVFCLPTTTEAAKLKKGTVSTPIEETSIVEWPQLYDTSESIKLYQNASNYIGLQAKENAKTLKTIINVDPVHTPWCAAFVNAILGRTGKEGTNSLAAVSFANYGKNVKEPQKGDIVVFKNHVGFYDSFIYKDGEKYVGVLGGNQKKAVRISFYRASKVIAYRRVV